MGRDVTLTTKDGPCGAYLAEPAAGRGSAVVVIQEIFGVNAYIRAICDAHAARGRYAIAPDLFWRIEPGVQLTDQKPDDWQKAFGLMNRLDTGKAIDDIQAALSFSRTLKGASGKAGAVGYCLGGKLAYMTASRTDSNATVGYYGLAIETMLDEASNIKAPLMLHVAGKDKFVPKEAQDKIAAALSGHPRVTMHVYPEMNHAFARPGGEHYDRACAELADERTHTFFNQHLG